MHIAIDAHAVGANLGGNETYAVNLIEALAEIDKTNLYTLYVTKQSAIDRFSNRWPNVRVTPTLPHTPLVRIPLTLSAELRKRPVDVLHVQYTAPPLAPCPVVATIHDLSFEHLPETFNRRSWMQLRLTVRRTARRAAHLITLSEYSRNDIHETYKIPLERITVTPAAAPQRFARVMNATEIESVCQKYRIREGYILTLSSIQPRKNLVRLIEAYSYLKEHHLDADLPQLVIAGKKGWLENEVFRVANESAAAKDILFTGYVPDAELPALLTGALCFVYPSYFEGFGLPVLEAMQCGTPVIAGNRTSLPEVVGDAGILIDPFDHKDLANAMARLLASPECRHEFSERGIKKASAFNWLETARLTLQTYRQVSARL